MKMILVLTFKISRFRNVECQRICLVTIYSILLNNEVSAWWFTFQPYLHEHVYCQMWRDKWPVILIFMNDRSLITAVTLFVSITMTKNNYVSKHTGNSRERRITLDCYRYFLIRLTCDTVFLFLIIEIFLFFYSVS